MRMYVGKPRDIQEWVDTHPEGKFLVGYGESVHFSEISFECVAEGDNLVTQSKDVLERFLNHPEALEVVRIGRSARRSDNNRLIATTFVVSDSLIDMVKQGFELR